MEDELQSGLTYRTVAARIDRDRRTVERLVKAGRLQTIGSGQARKITIESLREYLETRALKIERQTSEVFPQNDQDGCTVSEVLRNYEKVMLRTVRRIPALSSAADVARRLGIPEGQVKTMVAAGAIPSITIGVRRFIPQCWLIRILAQAGGLQSSDGLVGGREAGGG
jgi:hypothetical protein